MVALRVWDRDGASLFYVREETPYVEVISLLVELGYMPKFQAVR